MSANLLFDPIPASRKQPLASIAQELSERLPRLVAMSGFVIGRNEGYQPGVFGARAGLYDDLNVQNVLHEVAHAIEMKHSTPTRWKHRLNDLNYGMRIKSFQTVLGERYHEPRTTQATERECRVGAIQLHLLEMGGYRADQFTGSFVRSLKYMADSYLGGDCILNAYEPDKYTDGQKEWVRLRTEWLQQEYLRHTPDSIYLDLADIVGHLHKKKFEIRTEVVEFRSTPHADEPNTANVVLAYADMASS